MSLEKKPPQWILGATARLDNLGRDKNPFKFPNPNPRDNEPWSHWNHGWSWADTQIRLLKDAAKRGWPAQVKAEGTHLRVG